ncbi:MAG TPA: SIR2 family protein [Parafilimonas sp.]|nr:SIR2 family protein [Parafilimonas sp.]
MFTTQKSGKQDPIVIFAGAGCSVAAPSLLPDWKNLNNMILNTLWDKVENYNLPIDFREKIIKRIQQRRDENAFPADYQAQVMAERAGIKYFELLSAVDSDAYNAVQYYAAILAKAGIVKAVVTTNFDQNFEHAFAQYEVKYRSVFDEESFDELIINEGQDAIPLIKIHGCCSSPSSMIDTRKQRLKGRAKALENLLQELLRRYWFIFSGFSGQDFDDNENYLGFQEAALTAKGLIYLNFPGSGIRAGMLKLLSAYETNKVEIIECDPADYFKTVLEKSKIPFEQFSIQNQNNLSINDRLKLKTETLELMDCVNMMIALAESYGDEISARYLYDSVWQKRLNSDYTGSSINKFLLNHARSYIFNLQDRAERAEAAGVILNYEVDNIDDFPEEVTNPAKRNLNHLRNDAAENLALIALGQTYIARSVLFADFPQSFTKELLTPISSIATTEAADIVFYYSFYMPVYGDIEKGLEFLSSAILEMEKECDEPRLAQLLSRRAIILSKTTLPRFSLGDASKAKALAEKYHEPHLIALSSLALAACARKNEDFNTAFNFIREAEKIYSELKRIPQYIETIIEYLKIIKLGLDKDVFDKAELFTIVSYIKNNLEKYIIERVPVYEPEYCYLMAMILGFHSTVNKNELLRLFADSISLAEKYQQDLNYAYFKQTCIQLNIFNEVEELINKTKEVLSNNI